MQRYVTFLFKKNQKNLEKLSTEDANWIIINNLAKIKSF